jgi:signal transduction histidine kinase
VLEALAVLVDKVDLFQRLVLGLLEISRIDGGTASLGTEPIDLEHFLPRIAERHGAPGSVVTFADGAPRHLLADRRRLAQALGNLIENAGAYAGGVTAIVVSGSDENDVHEEGVLRIAVDDAGPGVPIDEREAVFGRFARGQQGRRSGPTSGAGLGLSLVAEHVGLHGGRTWVEAAPSGGARFVIELPLEAP